MRMSTYDTRQGWQSPHAAAVAARSTEAATAWEQELGQGSVDEDTWLVSFVDILMLVLTLFVLLLAYKDDLVQTQPVEKVAAAPVVETLATVPPAPAEAPRTPVEVAKQRPQPEPVASHMQEAAPQEAISRKSPTQPAVESPVEPVLPMTVPLDMRLVTPPHKPMTRIAGMPGMFGLPETLEATAQPERIAQAEDQANTPSQNRIRKPIDTLLAELQDSALQGRIEVTVLPDSVNLEISDSILFAPASAALTASGMQLLDELAGTLKTHPYTLSVEGHTDNVPIKTARFPSNWELSSTRATEVTRRLIERGVAPDRVRAVGYADTHPRADNISIEGRARNRRVSLVLMETAE